MRLFIAAVAATTLTLTGSLGATAYADPSLPEPALDHAAEQAVEALEHAEDVLQGKGDDKADPTMALVELHQSLGDLPRGRRAEARALFARPDQQPPVPGSPEDITGAQWSAAETAAAEAQGPNCRANVCVHYIPTSFGGRHRATDSHANLTAHLLQVAWNSQVGTHRFLAPLPDGDRGGDDRLDVYLSDVGAQGYYGYAVPEGQTRRAAGYLVLDNDYRRAQYGAPAWVSLMATAAHELFHTVQFAYDSFEALWFMESTATWAEELVFDQANDNRFYLSYGSLRHPGVPLNASGGLAPYGNWAFWQYLHEKIGPNLVHDIWTRASWGLGSWDALRALETALTARHHNLNLLFSKWSAASNIPGRVYSEGNSFPAATVAGTWTLGRGASTGTKSPRLSHLSSRNFVFRPGSGLTGGWRLRVSINGPSGDSAAYALVKRSDGSMQQVRIPLNRYGDGTRLLPFGRGSVVKVTLNISNGSKNVNGRLFRWSARAVR